MYAYIISILLPKGFPVDIVPLNTAKKNLFVRVNFQNFVEKFRVFSSRISRYTRTKMREFLPKKFCTHKRLINNTPNNFPYLDYLVEMENQCRTFSIHMNGNVYCINGQYLRAYNSKPLGQCALTPCPNFVILGLHALYRLQSCFVNNKSPFEI